MFLIRIITFWGALAFVAGAQAQIAFRAATSAGVSGPSTIVYGGQGNAASRNGCGTITPTLPGGTAAGNLLIAVVATADDSTIAMAGWNTFYNNIGATNEAAAIFWRIATGGDPTTIAQSGNCNAIIGRISRFTGVDPVQPFDAGPSASFQNATTVSSGSVSVPYSGAMVVFTAHTNDNASTGALAGFTLAYNSQTTSGIDAAISLYYDLPANVPPYTAGPYTVTKTRGSDNNQGVAFTLRPLNSRLTLNVPAGTAANDVLIASVAVTPSGTTVTPPIGWTATLDTPNGSATTSRLVTFYRVATGAEPASYTFDLDGSLNAGAAGEMIGFSGVDTASPINTQGGTATASGLTHTANAVTTTVANAMVVGAFEFASAPSAGNFNPTGGQGMTKALAQPSVSPASNAGVGLVMSYGLQAAAGTTSSKSAVASGVTADRGAAQLLALRPALNLDHYAISVLSSTVPNCDYAQVTISGHDSAHNLVIPPAGRSLTLNTSIGTGVWQAGTVAGTGAWTPSGANNGSATYVWPGGAESSFTVRLRQSAVTSLSINLNDGFVVEDALEDPAITFVNSAFRISDGTNTASSVGTQIAGKASNVGFGAQTLYLQAVRTDVPTGACVSLFPNGSDVSVEVGAQCNNPASCSRNLTLASSAASSNTAVFVPSGAYAGSMNFRFTTGNAEAPFALNYGDAGQITLLFRAQLPSPPAGQFVSGTSNAFVVRPFGFAFRGANALTAASHGTDDLASVLAAAGDNFTMTLGAYAWLNGQDANNDGVPDSGVDLTGNGLTPNFAAATTVGIHALGNLAGQPGAISRASGAATVAAGEWSGGAAVVNNWRYSEVGNVFLTATSADYLGDPAADVAGNSGLDGTGAAGGYIGRFRPKQFVVANAALTNRLAEACAPASTFTYMNERLRLQFDLAAQNAQGATTANYNGAYAKLVLTSFGSWSLGARSGATGLVARVSNPGAGAPPAGSWSNGTASGVTITTGILRATPDSPDGPYPGLQFGIAPVDSDGTAIDTLDFDADNNGVNERHRLEMLGVPVSTEVRFGRLRIDNAVGGEMLRLPVPMRLEYWNAGSFATNAADSCTRLARSDIALDFTPVTNLVACETRVESDPVTFASGVAALALTAPGAGNHGSVLLTANLGPAAGSYCNGAGSYVAATSAARPYLLGRWNDSIDPDGDGNTMYDDPPGARAAFGVYGSQPKNFIYFRENY